MNRFNVFSLLAICEFDKDVGKCRGWNGMVAGIRVGQHAPFTHAGNVGVCMRFDFDYKIILHAMSGHLFVE